MRISERNQQATTAEAENRYSLGIYKKRDLTLVRGAGVYLYSDDGEQYLDMMSNYGVNILGHSHPAIAAALTAQSATLISCHQSFSNDARARFLEQLSTLLPDRLAHISFANSGAEAVEAALKYARVASGRSRILATRRSYHGRTLGALSVTGEPKHRTPFEPLLAGVEFLPYGDLEAMRAALPGAAAVILEPVQGESGVRPAAVEYLRGLRAACDESGTVLIFDEVQTAFRTGHTWAWEHSAVQPDIMTLSKPLANGLPIGLTCVATEIAERVPAGSHGSTFGGNPLVCAVAHATLEIAGTPAFNEHVLRVGAMFQERLRAITHPMIREVRGVGLMIAVELKRNASPVLQCMQANGVLAIPAGSTCVRFLPPLIVEEEHAQQAATVFEQSLVECE